MRKNCKALVMMMRKILRSLTKYFSFFLNFDKKKIFYSLLKKKKIVKLHIYFNEFLTTFIILASNHFFYLCRCYQIHVRRHRWNMVTTIGSRKARSLEIFVYTNG